MFGWSEYSDTIGLEGIDVPNQLPAPVTSNVDDKVLIDWFEAVSNGSPLIRYKIEIQSDSGFYEDLINCDGSANAIISTT